MKAMLLDPITGKTCEDLASAEPFALIKDDAQPIPHATCWETGLAARLRDGAMGLGLVLRGADGSALSGAMLTPQEAVAQAQYLFRTAARLLHHLDPDGADEAARAMLHEYVQLLYYIQQRKDEHGASH